MLWYVLYLVKNHVYFFPNEIESSGSLETAQLWLCGRFVQGKLRLYLKRGGAESSCCG